MQAIYMPSIFKRLSTGMMLTISLFVMGLSSPSTSLAENVTGKWHFDYGYFMEFTQSGNTFSGFGGEGSSYTWPVTNGVINGNQVSWHEKYNELPSYEVDRVGTINGDTITGTWTNTGGTAQNPFTATRVSGGGTIPTPTPGANSKRPTVTALFCNRGGVLLERASCAATVGDAGAPIRTTPTGVISFASNGGFFPANAQCFPQQTPYSPGVASCIVEFQIPNGFPVGAKFPIDATYEGNSTFAPSSTSHTLIQAGCVGDAAHPCSGAVALSFSDIPQILKGKVKTIFECGGLPKAKSLELNPRGLGDAIQSCAGVITVDSKVSELLSKLAANELTELVNGISKHDAQTDALLDALRTAKDPKYQLQLQNAVGDQIKIENLMIKILNDRSNAIKNNINNIKRLPFLRAVRKAKRSTLMSFGSSLISVKNNKAKVITVNLTKPSKLFLKAFSKATTDRALDLTFTIKGKRIGTKKTFKSKQVVRVGVGN